MNNKKNSSPILWLCLLSGLFFLPNTPVLGVPLLCLWGYLLIKRKRSKQQVQVPEAEPVSPAASDLGVRYEKYFQLQETHDLIRTIRTKVAGVTFQNDDGSFRQDNLLSCIPGEFVDLEYFDYMGSPAYAVICDHAQLGNLPADLARDLHELRRPYVMVAQITDITGDISTHLGCNLSIELFLKKKSPATVSGQASCDEK